ncbi:MAG: PepSY-associated TM helix domain-containing protein [Bacteroidota bacterium]
MKAQHYIESLRKFRIWHRGIGIVVSLLVIVSATTGILLALKKDVNKIQPSTQKGISTNLSDWKPIPQLAEIAQNALAKQESKIATTIDRIDVRPSKGIVKVLFKEAWWEVQVDGNSGEVLSIAKRHSDWIEALHDGSIISDGFKLISMNVLGFGLLLMVITGIWLWYGPKRYRKWKDKRKNEI